MINIFLSYYKIKPITNREYVNSAKLVSSTRMLHTNSRGLNLKNKEKYKDLLEACKDFYIRIVLLSETITSSLHWL